MISTANPYESLAEAIVLQAVKDYRKALKTIRKNPKSITAMSRDKAECEKFFKSDWFMELTALDGELVLERLREEV